MGRRRRLASEPEGRSAIAGVSLAEVDSFVDPGPRYTQGPSMLTLAQRLLGLTPRECAEPCRSLPTCF